MTNKKVPYCITSVEVGELKLKIRLRILYLRNISREIPGKQKKLLICMRSFSVGPLGLEPRTT